MTFLDSIDIHSDEINHAYEICKDRLTELGLYDCIDSLCNKVIIDHYFNWENPTISMISGLFKHTENLIEGAYGKDVSCSYSINGYDSTFFYNAKYDYQTFDDSEWTWYLSELLKQENVYLDTAERFSVLDDLRHGNAIRVVEDYYFSIPPKVLDILCERYNVSQYDIVPVSSLSSKSK